MCLGYFNSYLDFCSVVRSKKYQAGHRNKFYGKRVTSLMPFNLVFTDEGEVQDDDAGQKVQEEDTGAVAGAVAVAGPSGEGEVVRDPLELGAEEVVEELEVDEAGEVDEEDDDEEEDDDFDAEEEEYLQSFVNKGGKVSLSFKRVMKFSAHKPGHFQAGH